MAAHYRKVELQSAADFTYLYANTVALSRRKLDLHLPPSAANNEPDPMRERVRELVDEYINETFTTASSSISINGIDSSSPQFPFPASFTAPDETVEYEAYDADLASRVTALYAQLESLTTSVAQLRREAPRKAAREYAALLRRTLEEEEEEEKREEQERGDEEEAMDESEDVTSHDKDKEGAQQPTSTQTRAHRQRRKRHDPAWTLQVPLGTEEETERWQSEDMAAAYDNALRMLLRLQGEEGGLDSSSKAGAVEGNALATTVGKAERAGRAAEVVENL
ncbi:Kinetochore Mis14 [Penicillium lagena]|uniref:Kinetochore Mis14 n=1 Tax=Penicillium lagena TaxID=94218 RepID=UPI002540EF93|nr:Kinetochore Mis14 [Penicillium lagena]KAJ5601825.1 Kinetochore Mis14 [Penicillium lagena]